MSQDFGHDDGKHKKQVIIICVIITICIIVAIILLVVNIFNDFNDLHSFHQGFLGRQLMMEEGRLLSRETHQLTQYCIKEETPRREKETKNGDVRPFLMEDFSRQGKEARNSGLLGEPGGSLQCLLPGGVATELSSEPTGCRRDPHPPGTRMLEDEEPEWQEMDYLLRIGKPPESCKEFFLQFNWNKPMSEKELTDREWKERENLYSQFRIWKSLKRKRFNIVVTQRAKKEMSNKEKAGQAKLNQRVKLENAEHYRKMKEIKRRKQEEKMLRSAQRH